VRNIRIFIRTSHTGTPAGGCAWVLDCLGVSTTTSHKNRKTRTSKGLLTHFFVIVCDFKWISIISSKISPFSFDRVSFRILKDGGYFMKNILSSLDPPGSWIPCPSTPRVVSPAILLFERENHLNPTCVEHDTHTQCICTVY